MAETTVISPHAQQQLVSRLRAGDMDAFTEIYHAFFQKATHWAFNILDDREQSLDIAQDTLLWLWANRATLPEDLTLDRYLYGAVRNACLKVIRHGKVKDRVFDQIEKRIWRESTNSSETESVVHQRELQQKLKAAIADLPELAQEVYRLSREEHLNYQEIADRLQLKNAKAAENQLLRAVKKIRESLSDFLPLLLLFMGGK